MDVDTNTGRGEQVTEYYLPGAGTNYERKNIEKSTENYTKTIEIWPIFKKKGTN